MGLIPGVWLPLVFTKETTSSESRLIYTLNDQKNILHFFSIALGYFIVISTHNAKEYMQLPSVDHAMHLR